MRRPGGVSDALTGTGPSLSTIDREKGQYTNEGLIRNGGGALCDTFAAAIMSAVTFFGTAAAAALAPLPVAAVVAGKCWCERTLSSTVKVLTNRINSHTGHQVHAQSTPS